MSLIDRLIANPAGALAVLACAAMLEAWGDSCFQSGFYRTAGWGRITTIVSGVVVLSAYGALVNVPRWNFGRLIGAYVALFFLAAQLAAKVRYGQSPSLPVYVGGALILAGGLVISFWQG